MRAGKSYWLILAVVIFLTTAGIAMGLFYVKRPLTSDLKARPVAVVTNAVASTVEASPYRSAVLMAFRENDPVRRAIAFGNAFADWFEHDPEAALAWLRQMPEGNEYTQGMFIALQAICQTDPQRALALAVDMAKTREQKAIYNALFNQLAKSNISSATSLLQFVPPGEARENAIRTVSDNWSRQDIAAAWQWAGNLENAGERAVAMESILTSLAGVDPRQALDLAAQNLDGAALDRVLEKSLHQLAVMDPFAAASAVGDLPEGELQKSAAMQVARALATQNPVAAISWTQTLPVSAQSAALNNALEVWLSQDAAAAGQYVAELSSAEQDAVISRFAENYAEKDSAAAIAWAGTLTTDSAQNAAVVSIASGWARQEPEAATQWAVSLPADMSSRAEAMRGAYSYWKLADATEAANFLKTLANDDQAAIASKLAAK